MKCFIGYDAREDEAFKVLKHSIIRHASECLEIIPLKDSVLRNSGVYKRGFHVDNGVKFDLIDGKPFSTDFSFTRFLVPHLSHYSGWSLFLDCDMLVTRDIKEVFDLADPQYAVMCVKHDYRPEETIKMDGQPQQQYSRKNWSSFVLWNCGHKSNSCVTPAMVNAETGLFLHGFKWLQDEEIGALPETWNWLEGTKKLEEVPANIHLTRGGPWFSRYKDVDYADLWLAEKERL